MSYQSHTPASQVQFEKIGQIAITVTDVAGAKDFYQNMLGMRFLFEAGPLAFFQCGDIRLMLSNSQAAEPRGGTVLYFKVEDIDAAYRDLKGRGVAFRDAPHVVARLPGREVWMAFFDDSEGNLLAVTTEKAVA